MAVLTDQQRADGVATLQRSDSFRSTIWSGVTKADLAAAFNALDSFMDANASAINQAIPLPARTALSTAQKALILTWVVQKRFGG